METYIKLGWSNWLVSRAPATFGFSHSSPGQGAGDVHKGQQVLIEEVLLLAQTALLREKNAALSAGQAAVITAGASHRARPRSASATPGATTSTSAFLSPSALPSNVWRGCYDGESTDAIRNFLHSNLNEMFLGYFDLIKVVFIVNIHDLTG